MQASKPKFVGSIDKLRVDRLNRSYSLEQQCKVYEKEIQELRTENEALPSADQILCSYRPTNLRRWKSYTGQAKTF